jgi:hypothetical protein
MGAGEHKSAHLLKKEEIAPRIGPEWLCIMALWVCRRTRAETGSDAISGLSTEMRDRLGEKAP